ncbi:WD40-repeat-containing domain protein [Mycena vitilis]|nr:WD40-repeat-containing domain protein [Mycena vitilis]
MEEEVQRVGAGDESKPTRLCPLRNSVRLNRRAALARQLDPWRHDLSERRTFVTGMRLRNRVFPEIGLLTRARLLWVLRASRARPLLSRRSGFVPWLSFCAFVKPSLSVEVGFQVLIKSAVWIVSNEQLLAWVKNPVPVSQLGNVDALKLWDVETHKAKTAWTLGAGVPNQQLGNAWSGEADIVSLSLSGDLNVFDARVGDKPARVITGPQKPVTAVAPSGSGTFLAATADGRVLEYTAASGEAAIIVALAAGSDGKVFSAGFDDHVREIGGTSFSEAAIATAGQPKALAAAADGTVFVVEANGVEAIRNNQKVAHLETKYAPSAVGASGALVAVGGEDQKVRLYEWSGTAFKEVAELDGNKGPLSALALSPDGAMLAAGDARGGIVLFDVKQKNVITTRWSIHAARVNSLSSRG